MTDREIRKRSVEEIIEEMKIKVLASNLRKQLKYIIEWGNIEDMEDALGYLSNINIRAAEESIKSVDEAMRKEA